ncbi:MAG TPA: PhzF family phenazine biosynthesis protein, partial [Burkholderiaceae bacterium]
MEVFNLLCFGAAPGVGNRAQMVLGGPADPAERQRWAAQARVNACVFIDGADHAPVLDYWYPHARSPLCLHATLAASHVLFARRPQAAQIEVATAMQGQHLALRREGSLTFIGLEAQLAPSCDVTQAELTA